MSNEFAIYTTCYPGVEAYLPQWCESVAAQIDKDFDICIGLDSITPIRAKSLLGEGMTPRFFPVGSGVTPATVRSRALGMISQDYKGVIMTDADDLLLPGRVSRAKKMLASSDLCCCGMQLMTDGQVVEDVFFDPGAEVRSLLLCNVFGLSNTAYTSALLRECLPVPPECVLFDWLLATRAWLLRAKISFDRTPQMVYRQYPDNTARILPPFTAEHILKACRLVLDHHTFVLSDAHKSYSYIIDDIEKARQKVENFSRAIQEDIEVLRRYTEALNRLPPCHVWWDCVAHPALEYLWKN